MGKKSRGKKPPHQDSPFSGGTPHVAAGRGLTGSPHT